MATSSTLTLPPVDNIFSHYKRKAHHIPSPCHPANPQSFSHRPLCFTFSFVSSEFDHPLVFRSRDNNKKKRKDTDGNKQDKIFDQIKTGKRELENNTVERKGLICIQYILCIYTYIAIYKRGYV